MAKIRHESIRNSHIGFGENGQYRIDENGETDEMPDDVASLICSSIPGYVLVPKAAPKAPVAPEVVPDAPPVPPVAHVEPHAHAVYRRGRAAKPKV